MVVADGEWTACGDYQYMTGLAQIRIPFYLDQDFTLCHIDETNERQTGYRYLSGSGMPGLAHSADVESAGGQVYVGFPMRLLLHGVCLFAEHDAKF